jgi:DNA-binding NarL/FixJ family response regulator
MFPQINGFALTEELHRISPDTPVVALTLNEKDTAGRAVAAGVDMLLLKGGVKDEPLTAIRDVTRTASTTYLQAAKGAPI